MEIICGHIEAGYKSTYRKRLPMHAGWCRSFNADLYNPCSVMLNATLEQARAGYSILCIVKRYASSKSVKSARGQV